MKILISIVLFFAFSTQAFAQAPTPADGIRDNMLPRAYLPITAKEYPLGWSTVFTTPNEVPTDAAVFKGHTYVSVQSGRLYRDGVQVMQIPVTFSGEAGLLSLATNGQRLFAGYVSQDMKLIVAEIFPDAGLYKPMADFGAAAIEHNIGGMTVAGVQLLVGIGDNSPDGTTNINAQLPSKYGRVHNINLDTGSVSEYAKGFRNPYTLSQPFSEAEVYVADVGESETEELNLLNNGANYGWPCYEGSTPRVYNPQVCNSVVNYTASVSYTHGIRGRSIVGAARFGQALAYADFDINPDPQGFTGAVMNAYTFTVIRAFEGCFVTRMKQTVLGATVMVYCPAQKTATVYAYR